MNIITRLLATCDLISHLPLRGLGSYSRPRTWRPWQAADFFTLASQTFYACVPCFSSPDGPFCLLCHPTPTTHPSHLLCSSLSGILGPFGSGSDTKHIGSPDFWVTAEIYCIRVSLTALFLIRSMQNVRSGELYSEFLLWRISSTLSAQEALICSLQALGPLLPTRCFYTVCQEKCASVWAGPCPCHPSTVLWAGTSPCSVLWPILISRPHVTRLSRRFIQGQLSLCVAWS